MDGLDCLHRRGSVAADGEKGGGDDHDLGQDDDLQRAHRGKDAVDRITDHKATYATREARRTGIAGVLRSSNSTLPATAEDPDREGQRHPAGMADHDCRLFARQARGDQAVRRCRGRARELDRAKRVPGYAAQTCDTQPDGRGMMGRSGFLWTWCLQSVRSIRGGGF